MVYTPWFRPGQERAKESELWLEAVLIKAGLPAYAIPSECGPDGCNPDDHTDWGLDVLVATTRLQAKRRDFIFTSVHDFGLFGKNGRVYDDAIVDSTDARFHVYDWVVLISDDLKTAIACDVLETKHAWFNEPARDTKRGYVRTFIKCPTSLFVPLETMIETIRVRLASACF